MPGSLPEGTQKVVIPEPVSGSGARSFFYHHSAPRQPSAPSSPTKKTGQSGFSEKPDSHQSLHQPSLPDRTLCTHLHAALCSTGLAGRCHLCHQADSAGHRCGGHCPRHQVYCAVLTFKIQPPLPTGGQRRGGFSQYLRASLQASPSNPQTAYPWSTEMQLGTKAEEKRASPWENGRKGLET